MPTTLLFPADNNIRINNSEYYKLKEDVKAVVLNKIIEMQDNPNRIFSNVKMEVELEKNGYESFI